MAVESSTSVMDSLLEKLKLEEPWVLPRSWDSIPSQCGPSRSSSARYTTPTVSEASLVRLAINALQGVESALTSIEKLSTLLCCSPADRTSHRIPSLWTRSSSTAAVGNLLNSIGQSGCIVFLLHRFVDYFTIPDFGDVAKLQENLKSGSCEERKCPLENWSLVNQAFAISVGKVTDGYISALNTLSASIGLRRLLKTKDLGCLTSIGHSEVTLLEVYLHTTGLRTQIETLGNICNVNHLSVNFPVSSLEDLRSKAETEFIAFPRSGALLSFLYAQLKVADPDHRALLKFLFLKSYEPYCDFIRSWIFDGSISDPYHEFVVECTNELSVYTSRGTGVLSGSPLPNIRARDGAAIPCFLEECLVPLCRTGQQLQVIMKLLELSNTASTGDTHEEILPCLVGLSSECPWFAFPLAFDKRTIETMVLARASYYQQKQEKIASILTKFDFRYREAASQSLSWGLQNNLGKNLDNQTSSVADGSLIPQINDKRIPNMPDTIVDSEVSSTMDEYSYAEDFLESSECSSSGSFEDQDETEKLYFGSHNVEPSYLSALDFSSSLFTDNITQNLNQSENSCSMKEFELNIYRNSGCAAYSSHKETYPVNGEQKFSRTPRTWAKSSEDNLCLFDGHRVGKGIIDTLLHSPDLGLELRMGSCMPNTELGFLENATNISTSNEDHHQLVACATSKTFNLHFSKLKYDSSFFSMNPALNRGSFFIPRSMFGERNPAKCMDPYDFTSVKDPLETHAFKLLGNRRPKFGNELSVKTETPAAHVNTSNYLDKVDYNDIPIENHCKSSCGGSLMHDKGGSEEHLLLPNISGGSAWESLLGKSGNTVNRPVRDHRTRLVAGADMPLDFVVNKCVLDEILLQYHYLSKLSIKLLIEGFKLQEHLQALRCYHLMELADWADLFIMSLWRCKWHASEMDKRIPQIQGVLELAVQRSSCEGDPNKDRLYVYLKDGIRTSASAMGIHSFDFLGLGYRVDWPVSIILTPTALNIYSEIFNFLIQVKLAVFSLSDAWCSLKGYRMEQHKAEVHEISVLTETRHKINHFVSMLQQYVQSQLSQVSWYRLLKSLKHKVKDMLDLESVHMAYLTESLHICFVSDETRPVAGIIQKILQCAMDFGSCLTGSLLGLGSDDDQLSNTYSRINISQVHSIRRSFDKNLEELHLIYLQSPKHGEFGLSRFWDYLNYNDYYAGVMSKQMGHCIFY